MSALYPQRRVALTSATRFPRRPPLNSRAQCSHCGLVVAAMYGVLGLHSDGAARCVGSFEVIK